MYAMTRHEKNPSWPTEMVGKRGWEYTFQVVHNYAIRPSGPWNCFSVSHKPLTPWYEGKSAYKRKHGPWQQCLWYQWGAFWDFKMSNRKWCIPCFPTKMHPRSFNSSPLKNSGWKTKTPFLLGPFVTFQGKTSCWTSGGYCWWLKSCTSW